MAIGRIARCPAFRTPRPQGRRMFQMRARRFSTSTATTASPTAASPTAILASLTSELDRIAPRFDIQASQIRILESPTEFYQTLKEKISKAQSRIFLSTLYIGKTEHELISTIRQALIAHPKLKVSLLTDALRGTRETPEPSCASLLAPLVMEFGPDRVEIRMFHTPNLTGLRKKFIPRRINEGWGLQHMKLYGFDDEIIISGANLSSDYFSNRQDRYHVFSSKEMTDYFNRIHHAVTSLSYLVNPASEDRIPSPNNSDYLLEWPESNPAPSPLADSEKFIEQAGPILKPLIKPVTPSPKTFPLDSLDYDTVVYPLSQFTPLLRPDTSTEHPALTTVLRTLAADAFATSKWMFTAGYFSISPEFKSLLIKSKSKRGTVVTASPWANGFYGSKGVSGLLPPAYTLLSRRFLDAVHRAGKDSQIELKEWRRGTVGEPKGWSYHAKGLWVTLPREENPSLTLVGSSNYTKRSYSLDLEVNTLIVTHNEGLKKRLGDEQEWLLEHAREMTLDDFTRTERRVGITVRVALWIVGLVGGAL